MTYKTFALAAVALSACVTDNEGNIKALHFSELAYVATHPNGAATSTTKPAEDPSWASLPNIRGAVEAALLYSCTIGGEIPWDDYAYFYDAVRSAPDEFRRRDAIAAVRPQLERATAALQGHSTFRVPVRDFIRGEYDATRHGWPSPITSVSELTYHSPRTGGPFLVLKFTNAGDFSFLPIDEAAARAFAAENPNTTDRLADLDLEVKPVSARVQGGLRVLTATILRLRASSSRGGSKLTEVSAPSTTATLTTH